MTSSADNSKGGGAADNSKKGAGLKKKGAGHLRERGVSDDVISADNSKKAGNSKKRVTRK